MLIPLLSCSAQCKCRYVIIGAKYDLNNTVLFDVGELKSDGYYDGIQGVIPAFGSKIFIMNTQFGHGFKTPKMPGIIGNVIIGIYSKDFLDTINFNYGLGLTVFSHGVSIGINYTNMEHLGFKIGIVI
jgi:hypothetical protein